MFELGPAFPTVSTARRLEAVESGCRECKVRSNAGLMRVAKNTALHMASIVVHSPGFPVKVGGVDELQEIRARPMSSFRIGLIQNCFWVLSPKLPDGGRRRR